ETLEEVADRLGQRGSAQALRCNLALLAQVTAHWAIPPKAIWEAAECLDLAMLLDAAKEALGPLAQAASWIWWKHPCSAPFWKKKAIRKSRTHRWRAFCELREWTRFSSIFRPIAAKNSLACHLSSWLPNTSKTQPSNWRARNSRPPPTNRKSF